MTPVPPEAAPERLTAILRRAGVLERGEVVDVAVETARDTLVSRIARLRLTYGGGADAGPSHVFFKTQHDGVGPDWHERGRKEATFYALVAVATLWQDYRHSVLWQITTPMWQANHALPPVVWWNNLERIMLAVHDLGCLELLE